jgi:hypothetical protein
LEKIFFIAGAQRCGTTWLYNMLDQHPEILMAKPVKPEPKFFMKDNADELGKDHYFNLYFHDYKNETILGEKSTSYIEIPNVPGKIKKMFPIAKIIIILRNPVERTLSNYFFSVKNGFEKRSPEEVFLRQIAPPALIGHTSVSPFDYLKRSEYWRFIPLFKNTFGQENIKILIFEEMLKEALSNLKSVYSFLGVENNFVPKGTNQRINSNENATIVNPEILSYLNNHFLSTISETEEYLKRPINSWHQ